jgi:hypothetical protein
MSLRYPAVTAPVVGQDARNLGKRQIVALGK